MKVLDSHFCVQSEKMGLTPNKVGLLAIRRCRFASTKELAGPRPLSLVGLVTLLSSYVQTDGRGAAAMRIGICVSECTLAFSFRVLAH